MKRSRRQPLPKGWSAKDVAEEAAYYDNQTDEEAIAEMEEGFKKGSEVIVVIPKKLLPAVKRLIARAG
ncbi:MAG TPA: hypothetical protein VGP72_10110 [Planctomycetota bacterium]|jgi:hypothetical protein